MEFGFVDAVRYVLPLSAKDRENLEFVESFLDENDIKDIRSLLKTRKIGFSKVCFGISKQLGADIDFGAFHPAVEDKSLKRWIEKINEKIRQNAKVIAFQNLSKDAEKIFNYVSPNIEGHYAIKQAAVLQLFSTERFHILLLGDPGTGKTEIIRSAARLSPISSFGLGSGTSGAGLSVSFKGDKRTDGLLPLAHGGVCAIDELNLMKKKDMAALYSAMEKGFITYDKGSKHLTVDADVRVLATANPENDRFVGYLIDTIKKQVPFDAALLSRFNLIFMVRKPSIGQFMNITKKIVRDDKQKVNEADLDFIKDYVDYSHNLVVDFPKKFEPQVVAFIEQLKKNEDKFLVEINPRHVIGFIRLAKASARMDLRNEVNVSDLNRVKNILFDSLYIKKQ